MKKLNTAIVATALLLASGVSKAELIVNGGFEADSIGSSPWTYLSSVTGWTSSGTFEIQKGVDAGGLSGFNSAYEGTQYLELNSTGLTTVSQLLNTTIGETYTLSFAFSGRPDTPSTLKSVIEVYWDGAKLGKVTANPTSGWIEITFEDIVATSTSTLLSFKSLGPVAASSYGSYLDAVSVVAAVPEPSTYGMLALGLGVIGFVGSRKKKQLSA